MKHHQPHLFSRPYWGVCACALAWQAWQGMAWHGMAGLGKAGRRGVARHGLAGQGEAGQGTKQEEQHMNQPTVQTIFDKLKPIEGPDADLLKEVAQVASQEQLVEITIAVPLSDIDLNDCIANYSLEPSEFHGSIVYEELWEFDLSGASFLGYDVTFESDHDYQAVCDRLVDMRRDAR